MNYVTTTLINLKASRLCCLLGWQTFLPARPSTVVWQLHNWKTPRPMNILHTRILSIRGDAE